MSSVDPRIGNQIFENAILEAQRAGKTIIMVTYDPRFLSQCDRVLYMQGGSLVSQEKVEGEGLPVGDLDQSFVLVGSEVEDIQGGLARKDSTPVIEEKRNGAGNPTPNASSKRVPLKKLSPRECVWSLHLILQTNSHCVVWRTYFHAARGKLSVPTLALATIFMQTCQIIGSRSLVWWQFE